MAEALADSEPGVGNIGAYQCTAQATAFCRRAGEVTVVAAENGASGLNWKRSRSFTRQ